MYEGGRRLYCSAILELKSLQNFFSSITGSPSSQRDLYIIY